MKKLRQLPLRQQKYLLGTLKSYQRPDIQASMNIDMNPDEAIAQGLLDKTARRLYVEQLKCLHVLVRSAIDELILSCTSDTIDEFIDREKILKMIETECVVATIELSGEVPYEIAETRQKILVLHPYLHFLFERMRTVGKETVLAELQVA